MIYFPVIEMKSETLYNGETFILIETFITEIYLEAKYGMAYWG